MITNLANRPFVRSLAVVASGAAAAQAISVAFAPILTRLYGPEAFGMLGVFSAVVVILTPASTLSFHQAIVLPESHLEGRVLLNLALRVSLGVTALLGILLLLWRGSIAATIGFEGNPNLLLLVPFVVFVAAARESYWYWLVRLQQFRKTSTVAVKQAALTNVAKTAAGMFTATGPVLLLLNSLGEVAHWLMLRAASKATLVAAGADTGQPDQVPSIREMARRYLDFPLYRAPQALLNPLSQNIPTIMLAASFGPAAAGLFALARRVLQLPSVLISGSVGTVFLPKAVSAHHQGRPLLPLLVKATTGLALVGVVPYGLVALVGPWMFEMAFGREWAVAGEYARWLSVWLYFAFASVPSVQVIPLLGLHLHYMVYEAALFVLRVLALYAGARFMSNEVAAVLLFSMVGAAMNLGLVIYVLVHSSRTPASVIVGKEHSHG